MPRLFGRASRRRTTCTALAAVAAAILYLLLSATATTPANASYRHPCLPAQVNTGLDPVPYYDTWVQAATDTSSDGQVGVCVRPIGGGGGSTGLPRLFVGVGVGGTLVEGDPSMTGLLVQPQACAEVDVVGTYVAPCVTEGTTGAEANTSGSARVCVEQICQRVN